MKYSKYITMLILIFSSSSVFAQSTGGTGGLPTEVLNMGKYSNGTGTGPVLRDRLVIDSLSGNGGGTGDDFPVNSLRVNTGRSEYSFLVSSYEVAEFSRKHVMQKPSLLDLSAEEISTEKLAVVLSGEFSKLDIVSEEREGSSSVISREGLIDTILDMKGLTSSTKDKSTKSIESGKADILLVTDEEDQMILIDSSKIK